jgi:hypothetical protein
LFRSAFKNQADPHPISLSFSKLLQNVALANQLSWQLLLHHVDIMQASMALVAPSALILDSISQVSI